LNILGVSGFYHDASACLLQDGRIVAAAEEERFTRKKHCPAFPIQAIHFCLDQAGIIPDELDYVVYYERPIARFRRILDSHLAYFPRSFRSFASAAPSFLGQKLLVPLIIRESLNYDGQILFVEHHLSHAASSFLVSPFEEAALLTVDGVGERATVTCGIGRGNDILLLEEVRFPHSLGLLYSAVTAYLGFTVNSGEGKVMGLAAYGQPSFCDAFKRLIDIGRDGSFRLDMRYFSYPYAMRMVSDEFVRLFGPGREPDGEIEPRHADIACSLQKVLEEVMIAMATHLREVTGLDALCLAGGVALNCVANGRLLKETPFARLFIQPAANDAGTSLGAAAYVYHTVLGHRRENVMRDAFLGPEYSSVEIGRFLDRKRIPYRVLDPHELVQDVAQRLADGKIVCWFQGRMEFGPRALGNRSILADPRNPEMKDILNIRVKHREAFRPYAPAVLVSAAREYFDIDQASPFMLIAADTWPAQRATVPAVVHVDGSARVQTLTQEDNGLFYELVTAFRDSTGVPMVLNTSFNVRGQPIVCSPADAYQCFFHTEADLLVLGNYLVERNSALPDEGVSLPPQEKPMSAGHAVHPDT
jgi:carbamoyltransferase